MLQRKTSVDKKSLALFQKAFAAHQQNRLDEAEALYLQYVKREPTDHEGWSLLATLYSQTDRDKLAIPHFEKALKLKPNHFESMNNFALLLEKDKARHERAISLYKKALDLAPNYADARLNLGRLLVNLERNDEAAEVLSLLGNNNADALYWRAVIHRRNNRTAEAIQEIQQAITLNPNNAEYFNELGVALTYNGEYKESLEAFRRVIDMMPDKHNAWNNLGESYYRLGLFDEALQAYQQALALVPAEDPARLQILSNRAFPLFHKGDLPNAWEAFEYRYQKADSLLRTFPFPAWQGQPLTGKRILVIAEMGIGDEIIYASCLPDLIATGGKVVVECDPRLTALFERSFPEVKVIGSARKETGWLTEQGIFDYQVPLGSLPRYFRPSLDQFPARNDYFRADGEKTDWWRGRLNAFGSDIKVGICWRSGLRTASRQKYYSELSAWGEILKTPGVRFVSLQYDDCKEELALAENEFGIQIETFRDVDLFNDFEASASLINALDLVISAGTATCALSGALGQNTWRIDSYAIAWDTFGTQQPQMLPSITKFEQPTPGDWASPLHQIATALFAQTKSRPGSYGNKEETENPHYWTGFALQSYGLGKRNESAAACERVLNHSPEAADALQLLGALALERRDFVAAKQFFQRCIRVDRNNAEAHCNLASAQQHLGEMIEAIASYRQAIILRPSFPEAYCYLGSTYQELQRIEEAKTAFIQAIELFPAYVEALNGLGLCDTKLGLNTEAERAFDEALKHQPNATSVTINLANVYASQGRHNEAQALYQKLLTLQEQQGATISNSPEALSNFGFILWQCGRADEAIAYYQRAIEMDHGNVKAYEYLGEALKALNRFEEADIAFQSALALSPDDPQLHWYRAHTLLAQGKLEEGWREYQYRTNPRILAPRNFPYPEWDGKEASGKTILVYTEQGLGDFIAFSTVLPDLIANARHCVIECDPRLAPLIRRAFPQASVFGAHPLDHSWLANAPAIDYQCPIGSLPVFYRQKMEDFKGGQITLTAEAECVATWQERLQQLGAGAKIGICWRSGLRNMGRWNAYSALHQWKDLLATPGLRFINLQYDDCTEELLAIEQEFGIHMERFTDLDLYNDFDSTAALISALDLVLAAPTVIAELSAALGQETWYLVGHKKPWGCFGTDHYPWHRKTRLFYQHRKDDWESLIADMTNALNQHFTNSIEQNPVPTPNTRQLINIDDQWLMFDQSAWFAPAITEGKHYSPGFLQLITQAIQPGQTVISTSAGCGEHVLPIARALGPGGSCLAFEADPQAFTMLCANVALNEMNNVTCQPFSCTGPMPDGWEQRLGNPTARLSTTVDATNPQRCDLIHLQPPSKDALLATLIGVRLTLARFRPLLLVTLSNQEALDVISSTLADTTYHYQRLDTGLANHDLRPTLLFVPQV